MSSRAGLSNPSVVGSHRYCFEHFVRSSQPNQSAMTLNKVGSEQKNGSTGNGHIKGFGRTKPPILAFWGRTQEKLRLMHEGRDVILALGSYPCRQLPGWLEELLPGPNDFRPSILTVRPPHNMLPKLTVCLLLPKERGAVRMALQVG